MSIVLENISFEYRYPGGGVKALRNVSLDIPSGSFYAVMGETGSGKSTLLKLLNGLLTPSQGRIHLDGEDIASPSFDRSTLPFRVALVFQYPESQLFEESVMKDVAFGPMNMGKRGDEAEEWASQALESVGLPREKWNTSPFALSGGEKRRVALAGILAMKSQVLVLDEVASGLDGRSKDNIFSLLKKEQEKGKTIILVTHSADDAARYSDHMAILRKGEVVMEGETRKVFSSSFAPKTSAEKIAVFLRKKGYSIPSPLLTISELASHLKGVKG